MDSNQKLTYTNDEGLEVKTSQFLRNRGSCCRTSCLHCPYGFTLKNNDITFRDVNAQEIKLAQTIMDESAGKQEETSSIAASLMGSAFGTPKKKVNSIQINDENYHNYAFATLKEVVFGLIEKGPNQARKLYLREHFKEQGLDIDFINSTI
ncbi:hypothetical protein BALOs_1000 [Halobacteriovorax sp. BALOs_7]|uniref:DUF5522 domain-containing protein n=1 Tax=Halobacteriovorax sp. BALOs_7 TaxID=2109558 RepID=UPI000EA3563E|nr:DUF5522 domain-containing protein [Halobacteriovorax sp. BALOs_7]AYF44010.1 hypothetical protein BALOs_1000 [Halobacteriovorax sp. BALOs_7]